MFGTRSLAGWIVLFARCLAVCVVFLPPGLARAQDRTSSAKAGGGEVHGSVYADLGSPGNPVALAGFPVVLKNSAGRTADTTRTDASGRFRFHQQPPGSYTLSWDAPGWEAAPESLASIRIDDETEYVPPISVKPLKKDARGQALGVLRGRVKLADGSCPWFSDEFFGIDQTAEVSLMKDGKPIPVIDRDGKEVARAEHVMVNVRGDFVVAGLAPESVTVEARLVQRHRSEQGWTTWQPVSKAPTVTKEVPRQGFGDKEGVVFLEPLTLSGSRPQAVAVTATVDGKPVDKVRPGATVLCTPQLSGEEEGLSYTWKVPGSNATWGKPTFTWQVGDYEGVQTAYVLVSDGKGGFKAGRVSLSVGKDAKPAAAPAAKP
jgi:hypothetical protein